CAAPKIPIDRTVMAAIASTSEKPSSFRRRVRLTRRRHARRNEEGLIPHMVGCSRGLLEQPGRPSGGNGEGRPFRAALSGSVVLQRLPAGVRVCDVRGGAVGAAATVVAERGSRIGFVQQSEAGPGL